MLYRMWLCYLLVVLFALFLLQGVAHSQSFSFDASSFNHPGLQVDSTGRTFLATDNYLYRLNAQLIQEERVDLGAKVINRGLALSSTGMVVVCLVDLSCSVYNASNLNAGPIRSVRLSDVIASSSGYQQGFPVGTAIFTSGDTFYTGAMTDGVGEITRKMVLQRFGEGFNRSSDNIPSTRNELVFGISDLRRQFYPYGGFVSGGFAYYVVVDYQSTSLQDIRLLRVCNMPDCGGPNTCGVTALYELGINCVLEITEYTYGVLLGVSLVEDFSGISGPTAVVTISFGCTDSICVVNITAVNEAMDAKYDSCIVSRTAGEEIGLAWKTGSSENCSSLPQVCNIKCIS